MNNFLRSYKAVLEENRLRSFKDDPLQTEEEQLLTVLSSVVLLLRRHSVDNHLCCDDNENNLKVTGIDRYGFVTQVTCTGKQCQQIMETACYNAKMKYERIYHEDRLKRGDHICWHRPYAIWHHAIVTTVEPAVNVIHYSDLKIKEGSMPGLCSDCCVGCNAACSTHGCCGSCNALYRINYDDCYNAEYSVLRARKLLNETRYDLLERNCEHFSRWCKTGSTRSTQIGIVWASLAKTAVTIALRVFALILLGLLQYSHEAQENHTRDRDRLERVEVEVIVIYMTMVTVVFMVYLLIMSGSRLAVHPASPKRHDIRNRRARSCWKCCGDCCVKRYVCCLVCGFVHLLCRAGGWLCFWRHIRWYPCTCCRRPFNLACGLFWRIFFRETLANAGTLIILLNEEWITDRGYVAEKSARERTAILILCSTLAHIGGYIVGIIVGRLAEACCDCCRLSPTKRKLRLHNTHEYHTIN